MFFGRYQHLVQQYSVTRVQWRKTLFDIKFWFKVGYYFTILSYDGHVYYLIFKWWSRPLTFFYIIHMTNSVLRKLNFLLNNGVFLVICEGWHFIHMWKTPAWPDHFAIKGGLGSWNYLNYDTFSLKYLYQAKCAVLY